MAQAQNLSDVEQSDMAAIEWLKMNADPGQMTLLAKSLKIIIDTSGYGEITVLVKDGKLKGYPKMTVSVS